MYKELDRDSCPATQDYADYFVCYDCEYRGAINASFVECLYKEVYEKVDSDDK